MAPKYLREAEEWPDIEFCEIMFDNNKKLCKSLGIKILPCARPSPAPSRPPTRRPPALHARSYIEIIAGSDGKVDGFTCGPSKFSKLQARAPCAWKGPAARAMPARSLARLLAAGETAGARRVRRGHPVHRCLLPPRRQLRRPRAERIAATGRRFGRRACAAGRPLRAAGRQPDM